MDYKQASLFLEQTGRYGSVYGLDSIRRLMAHLGNVQTQLAIVHVAGTNGKGSVCAMLAAVLQAAGYRTGVYASPAVFETEEIIKVNGTCIPRETFAMLIGKVQEACIEIQKEGLPHPTAFEVETAVAFCFFQMEQCDIVLLEAGLGGAEDATNLVTHPLCSVLTSVSMDHMELLGHTLEEIAAAKAGIIKPGCPCVSSLQQPEVIKVFQKTAAQKGSRLYVADGSRIQSFSYDDKGSWFAAVYADEKKTLEGTLALTGQHQKTNLACVLEVISVLQKQAFCISREAVLQGLANVSLPGRFEKIAENPDFYIDGAHNEGAARCLRETVRTCLAGRRIVFIIGVFADKQYEKMLQILLPYAAQVITITPRNPRALHGEALADLAKTYHTAVCYVPDLAQAAAMAKKAAGADGAVLAFGSFSYLGKLKAIAAGIKKEKAGRENG